LILIFQQILLLLLILIFQQVQQVLVVLYFLDYPVGRLLQLPQQGLGVQLHR
jgi:hypothetical protein